jgi:hypothetical protein
MMVGGGTPVNSDPPVLVKITAPTLNTHLTSKLYVDTAISNVNVDTTNLSKLDQANTFTATNSFTTLQQQA